MVVSILAKIWIRGFSLHFRQVLESLRVKWDAAKRKVCRISAKDKLIGMLFLAFMDIFCFWEVQNAIIIEF